MSTLIDLDAFLMSALEQRAKRQPAPIRSLRSASVALGFASRCKATVITGAFQTPAYDPNRDAILLPTPTSRLLRRPALLATQILHELVHWSGAAARLNRPASQKRYDAVYNREELTAEIGAVLLSFDLGITQRPIMPNHKYLAVYLQTLDRPDVALHVALSTAQQAAGYVHASAGLHV
jgi:antirestriction protein ArdC